MKLRYVVLGMFCVGMLGVFTIMGADPGQKTNVGVVFAKSTDFVQSGKSNTINLYQVALRLPDDSTDTLTLPFDRFAVAKNGDKISYQVRIEPSSMQTFLTILGIVESLFGFLIAVILLIGGYIEGDL